MYRKIDDFITDWNTENNLTLKIFSKITHEIKSYKVNKNIRTIERLAWHITHTLTEMPFKAGLIKTDRLEGQPIPNNFSEIIEIYQQLSKELTNTIQSKWSDEQLENYVEIYGQQWEKRKLLSVIIKHQIHHRGQITILMRLQNTEVPGTYGPSKEEWIKFGMKPHK